MTDNYEQIASEARASGVTLVAVSKTRTPNEIAVLYQKGQRDYGENRVQELTTKVEELPKDIRWHLIGHLQKNKVKYIAPFVHLIHSVDSADLLREINKRAAACERVIPCLLQVHIAEEETKFGLSVDEVKEVTESQILAELPNVRIDGLMGMATLTDDEEQIFKEFRGLKELFDQLQQTVFSLNPYFRILSMGMSSDYKVAIACGSNMIRVGTLLFGPRS